MTADADITPARGPDNMRHLAAALRDLNARIYTEFVPEGLPFDVFGAKLDVASLEDIIRSKEAADRPQDRQDVLILRAMLRRRD
jgi:hypothetical protein